MHTVRMRGRWDDPRAQGIAQDTKLKVCVKLRKSYWGQGPEVNPCGAMDEPLAHPTRSSTHAKESELPPEVSEVKIYKKPESPRPAPASLYLINPLTSSTMWRSL